MARKTEYTKEKLLNKSIEYVINYGIQNFNIRDLAKYSGCSTQPFFKNYTNIEEFKKDLKDTIHKHYEDFINKYIDTKHYLLTISYAYALYAMYNPNCFYALFITDMAGTRTVDEVLKTDRNVKTIEALKEEYNLSYEKANAIYRDVRFYTHGIATQLCINSIKLEETEIYNLIERNIRNNLRGE